MLKKNQLMDYHPVSGTNTDTGKMFSKVRAYGSSGEDSSEDSAEDPSAGSGSPESITTTPAGNGNAAQSGLDLPVYAGIGGGAVLIGIIIILLIILCCVLSKNRQQDKNEPTTNEGERKMSGHAFSTSFVYKKDSQDESIGVGPDGYVDMTQTEQPDNVYTALKPQVHDNNQNRQDAPIETPIKPVYDNNPNRQEPIEPSDEPLYDNRNQNGTVQKQEDTHVPSNAQSNVELNDGYLQESDDAADPVYFQLERADSLKENGDYAKTITDGDNNGEADNYGYLDVSEINGQYDTFQRGNVISPANSQASAQVKLEPTISEDTYQHLN
ncbi:uncharacterized protein [Amphiura filiformis]|uniref:uncharacterized protein n=1 Tax=Amphiura filiformis TaxID=82378 RepID=UPI003B220D27